MVMKMASGDNSPLRQSAGKSPVAAAAEASEERQARLRPPPDRWGRGCPPRRPRGHPHGRKKMGEVLPPTPTASRRCLPLDAGPATAKDHQLDKDNHSDTKRKLNDNVSTAKDR